MTEDLPPVLPAAVVQVLDGQPVVGELDQAFLLLTCDATGLVDVCLLSRTEVAPVPGTATGQDAVRAVVASTKARRNLAASSRATLVVVCGDAAHYLGLEVRRTIEGDGALGVELGMVRYLRDDAGVELQPLRFRVAEGLRVAERWERTAALLAQLAECPA